jgi:hypothetical protein
MQIMFSVIITALAVLIIITAPTAASGRGGGSNKLRVHVWGLTITNRINTSPTAHLLMNQLIREASSIYALTLII